MSIWPKNKSSKGRRDKRRANWKMSAPTLVKCSKCGALMMPHRVCSSLISSTFGRFILRTNRHRYTSLFALKISWIAAIRGSGTKVSQPHSFRFLF